MKIIAFHLPQFHEIPENNEWWGKGFTEWVNVRKARPLFDGHNQPRVPLNDNYYDLTDAKSLQWQVNLAKEYGIYGFCFYHYWFDGKLLLQKPVEMFLEDKSLDFHYCICWANEHWTNSWVDNTVKVLIEQHYGGPEEWKTHFEYLLPFFQDERYIKKDNKPLLVIYRAELIDCLNEMLDYLNEMAIECGFAGMDFAYQHVGYTVSGHCDESRFTYALEYHPNCAVEIKKLTEKKSVGLQILKKNFLLFFENYLKLDLRALLKKDKLVHMSYDEIWEFIIQMKPRNEKCIPGAFVDWDNTPRKARRGVVYDGATPDKFKNYLIRQIQHARQDYKKDMIFIFAWNEWAEGGYLEPDTKHGCAYLNAIRNALIETGEFAN